ncbi:hypothetical protein SDC9_173425 [bioreactor metagenome]|uniref:DUF1659 domain-containing protein n=1 Tax=bioreactor metagenome TaxID=1076179 RepID=A0A645GQQ2_9ZZZZ
MAVSKLPQGAKLVIKVQTGVNASGNPVYRQRTYANIKSTAADADMYAIGEGLAGLQKHPATSITRTDENELVNE